MYVRFCFEVNFNHLLDYCLFVNNLLLTSPCLFTFVVELCIFLFKLFLSLCFSLCWVCENLQLSDWWRWVCTSHCMYQCSFLGVDSIALNRGEGLQLFLSYGSWSWILHQCCPGSVPCQFYLLFFELLCRGYLLVEWFRSRLWNFQVAQNRSCPHVLVV